MQLLAALDQIAEGLNAAIIVAAALVGLGMIVHATILLIKRLHAGSSKRAGIRDWARRVGEALLLYF
jgi:hypothetical protein